MEGLFLGDNCRGWTRRGRHRRRALTFAARSFLIISNVKARAFEDQARAAADLALEGAPLARWTKLERLIVHRLKRLHFMTAFSTNVFVGGHPKN